MTSQYSPLNRTLLVLQAGRSSTQTQKTNVAFQYRPSKRFNKTIRYYLVRAYILDIDSPILFKITDIIVGNINML
jgi:hypothetical protein